MYTVFTINADSDTFEMQFKSKDCARRFYERTKEELEQTGETNVISLYSPTALIQLDVINAHDYTEVTA